MTEREGHSWWEGSVAEALETDAGSLWGASRSRRPPQSDGAAGEDVSSPRQPGGVTRKQAQLGGIPSSAGCAAGEGHGRGGAGGRQ